MQWRFCEIGLREREAWDAALRGIPCSWWHLWEAADALSRDMQREVVLVRAESPGGAGAACVAMKRHWQGATDLCTPWGFTGFACSGDVSTLAAAWAEHAAGQGYVCGYFAMHPAVMEGGHFSVAAGHELYLLDLRNGIEPVLKSSHHSVARALRQWKAAGRSFVTDRERILRFLAREYRSFMESKGARAAVIWSEAALDALCNAASVLLVAAEDEHGIHAAHVVGWTPHAGDSLAIVSVREGRADTVPILWWAIGELVSRGVPCFNLGGGVRAGDSLARFKAEKFSPACVPLRSAREVYQPARFEELSAKVPPAARASGFFPPWHSEAAS